MCNKTLEKIQKIKKANDDIQKGKDLLRDLPNKINAAEKFVGDCCKSNDYFLYINLHPVINQHRGNLNYHQLDFKIQCKILKSIIEAIEAFTLEENK